MAISDDTLGAQLGKIEGGISAGIKNNFAIYQSLMSFREDSLLLSGRQACWALPRGRRIANLSDVEFKVFSQWGEDGIIEWLVSHVDLPDRRFIEFGADNFQEANCRFLMRNRNWSGLVMDSSNANIAAMRADPSFWKHDLTAVPAFINAENINKLIADAGFTGPVALLSIDVDGNDYWLWKAISAVSPAIVVCEYNAVLGDTRAVSIPYQANFQRFTAHHSGLYYGCSITALRHLGEQRGYTFVGTNSNGANAFFVRDDLAGPALAFLDEQRAFPSRFRDSRDPTGKLNYSARIDRLKQINRLPVIDIVTGETIAIGDIAQPYTDQWLAEMS